MAFPKTTLSRRLRRVAALVALVCSCLPGAVAATSPAACPGLLDALDQARHGDLAPLRRALPQLQLAACTALARARLAAAHLDTRAAQAALRAYRNSGDTDRARRMRALAIGTDLAFADGDYASAANSTQAMTRMLASHDPQHAAADVAQTHAIAAALAQVPVQQVTARRPHSISWQHDKAGLIRVRATIGSGTIAAVLDTGANLSVLSASAARRLGVHILGAESAVASGTRAHVQTGLGVVPRLRLAGIELRHVVVLVLADDQLVMPLPGGYRIDAILGFPVLRAIGRFRIGADHTFTPLPAAAAGDATPSNLRMAGNDLYALATVGGQAVALQLDTGAAHSQLSAAFAQRYRDRLRGLQRSRQRTASAGGANAQSILIWPQVPVALDGQTTTLSRLTVATTPEQGTASGKLGILGLDVLGRFAGFTVDLRRLRLQVEVPAPARP